MFACGDLLDDQFRIIKKLGEGSTGVVYSATDLIEKREVALKIFPPHLLSDKTTVARIGREMLAGHQITSKHVAKFYRIYRDNNTFAISMELIKGQTLEEYINTEPPNLTKILKLAIQICVGLKALHDRDIIHRDLKPSNIIIDAISGDAKIADLGLAKAFCHESQQRTHALINDNHVTDITENNFIVGTPIYMAPEYLIAGSCDKKSDLYSLGVIIYRMLVRKVPFPVDSMKSLMAYKQNADLPALDIRVKNCPKEFSELVSKLVARESEQRFQRIDDVLNALKQFSINREKLRSSALQSQEAYQNSRVKGFSFAAAALILVCTGYYLFGH